MNVSLKNNADCKLSLYKCRFCFTDKSYKDISEEYYSSGQKEIYEGMLKETFDMKMTYPDDSSWDSYLICDDCILRLRDAHAFKQMILKNEQRFLEYIQNLMQNKERELLNTETEHIKIEVTELNTDDIKCDDLGDDGGLNDDEILANLKQEMTRSEDVTTVKSRKRKPYEIKPKKKTKIKVNDEIGNLNYQSKKGLQIERRSNGPILRENSLKLLGNSTICVFQWNKSRYRCFCCKEPFSDMNTLKEHTKNNHTLENIEKIIVLQQNRLVKVEVSTLFCKICQQQLENLPNLREHLCKIHKFKLELNEDLLVPFKIDSGTLQCQICSENFNVFRLLNIHMNKHYQKQICHICGAGFSSLVFLNLHKTRSHRPLHCKQCDLVFQNKLDKKHHDVTVHNVKIERKLRFPCPYCNERFFQEQFRVQHLIEKHGMKRPEHKCVLCSKVFLTRSLCNNHLRCVHMKEKKHECDICHNLFYTKSDVARHRVTHTGEKKFLCSMCSNAFATKDSLRRHMKRTHIGVH